MWRTRQLVSKTNLQHLHLLSSSIQAQEGKKNKIWRAQPVRSVIWCLVLTQLRDTTATFRVSAVWLHLLCPVRVAIMLVRGLLPPVLLHPILQTSARVLCLPSLCCPETQWFSPTSLSFTLTNPLHQLMSHDPCTSPSYPVYSPGPPTNPPSVIAPWTTWAIFSIWNDLSV